MHDGVAAAFAAAEDLGADVYEMCVNAMPSWTKVGVETVGRCKGTLDPIKAPAAAGAVASATKTAQWINGFIQYSSTPPWRRCYRSEAVAAKALGPFHVRFGDAADRSTGLLTDHAPRGLSIRRGHTISKNFERFIEKVYRRWPSWGRHSRQAQIQSPTMLSPVKTKWVSSFHSSPW
jgi:hypothetical protein